MKRSSGILLPVFSLPGKYGIGCFSEAAYRFVDFLRDSGQSFWQILPLGPTGYGDSPYQSFSTFAGNPYFIDLEKLVKEGLLTEEECAEALGVPAGLGTPGPADGTETAALAEAACAGDAAFSLPNIDYGLLYTKRIPLLRKAYARSSHRGTPEFEAFLRENDYWLPDYALFMAVKDAHGGAGFETWEEDIRSAEPEAKAAWGEKLADDVAFYEYLQYEFIREWRALKAYANDSGIGIIGDIPIYVSADSADFWANRDLFMLDERGRIRMVAGVPPDGFSADGQLWGNPLYDWPKHKAQGYDWWLKRIGKCRELYDVVRIDHFRGFDEFFAIPAEDTDAKRGHWEKGPGIELFDAMRAHFGETPIIAEDLGYMTETVRKLVRDTGFPNMKVLEFAFDSRDSSGAMEYLPHRYEKNCAVYTGTHDNETVRGWIDSILPEELRTVKEYLDVRSDDPQEIVERMVRAAHASVADLCVIPMQDYLGLDNSARINHPSTNGTNWMWRMSGGVIEGPFAEKLKARIRKLTELYGRLDG